MTATLVRREVWLVRRVGDAMPCRHRWSCRVDVTGDGLDIRIAAPSELGGPALNGAAPAGAASSGAASNGAGLDAPLARLHDALVGQLPGMLRPGARVEVGIVRTAAAVRRDLPVTAWNCGYALVTCADVVVTLEDHLWPVPAVPWRGTCAAADLDPGLPVVLGPSAVLSLTAAALELSGGPAGRARAVGSLPGWLTVEPVNRSPYPPHDWPVGGTGGDRTEHWMRPMRTTRASRGRYFVHAALPTVPEPTPTGSAVWVESLVSLDTLGRCWHASLSVERDGGRWWLPQPRSVEIRAADLLRAAVGEVQPPRPALDRDPIDGESFGWAPGLLTGTTSGELGLRPQG